MKIYKINEPICSTPYGRFSYYFSNKEPTEDENFDIIDLNLELFTFVKIKGTNMFTSKLESYYYFQYNNIDVYLDDELSKIVIDN